jgi:hypothetical protein
MNRASKSKDKSEKSFSYIEEQNTNSISNFGKLNQLEEKLKFYGGL